MSGLWHGRTINSSRVQIPSAAPSRATLGKLFTHWCLHHRAVLTSYRHKLRNNCMQGCWSWFMDILTPWKYVGGVRVCYDPPPKKKMSRSFIQNWRWNLDNSSSFTSSRIKDLSKMEGKTNFLRCLNETVWWLDQTDPTALITTSTPLTVGLASHWPGHASHNTTVVLPSHMASTESWWT